MTKKQDIRDKIVSIISQKIPNISSITGSMGIEFGKTKRYFRQAQMAALKNTIVEDGDIKWAPFTIDNKSQIVCGIKNSKNPKTEIAVINGLIAEIIFEYFLQDQIERFIDPKSSFIKTIIETDELANFEQAIEKGDIIGVNLRSPQAVIIVEVPGLFKRIHDKYRSKNPADISLKIIQECQNISKQIEVGFKSYDQNIIGCSAPDKFVVLKWAKGDVSTLNTISFYKKKAEYIRKIISDYTGLPATAGAGQYYPGLAGLRKSYHDAEISLDLGRKIWGENKAYHITDIGMFISLSEKVSFERKAELAYQILDDVILDKDLYKTIRTFFDMNMNLTDAAKELHLHRNTLIYRLDKIKKEINLDPRKFSDAVHIKLGLLLYSPNNKKCDTDVSKKIDFAL